MRIDPEIVRRQISTLLLQYPELENDEILRTDMVEGSTDLPLLLRQLEQKRQEALYYGLSVEAHIGELKHRQARFDARDEALRALMFSLMQTANVRKMELPEATISIRLGSPKVIVTSESKLPDEYVRIKREPDKVRIKEALGNGAIIPGAEMSNATDVLSIRTK